MGRETPPGAGVRVWKAALYTRLSREDGDKAESNSIASQKAILEGVIARDPPCPWPRFTWTTAAPAPTLTARLFSKCSGTSKPGGSTALWSRIIVR